MLRLFLVVVAVLLFTGFSLQANEKNLRPIPNKCRTQAEVCDSTKEGPPGQKCICPAGRHAELDHTYYETFIGRTFFEVEVECMPDLKPKNICKTTIDFAGTYGDRCVCPSKDGSGAGKVRKVITRLGYYDPNSVKNQKTITQTKKVESGIRRKKSKDFSDTSEGAPSTVPQSTGSQAR